MCAKVQLPLDKQHITTTSDNGIVETVSMLDKRFMTDINFLQYSTFPIHEAENSPIQQEWHQEVKITCRDLEKLLSFSHQNFWVQLVHDSTLHSMLSTYLQKAPRSWDMWGIPQNFAETHGKLNRLIFMTLLRMSTDKESKDCYLSPEAFGFAIYENFMFDIPKVIDICSLYGHPYGGNGVMVNKMLTNIFTKQQSYIEDLKLVSQQIRQDVIPSISKKYNDTQTTIGLYDLLYYYYDSCMSLICLFSTYPPTLNYFDSSEMISSFSSLYNHLFNDYKGKLKKLSTPAHDLRSFKTMINRAQLTTVKLLHCIMWHSCLMDQLMDDSVSSDDHTRSAEQFIAQLSVIIDDRSLATKYYHECNLAKTFAIINNSKAEVGPDHFDYILSAIDIETVRLDTSINEIDRVHYDSSNKNPILSNGHSNNAPENISFLIDQVQSIFPQYDKEFVKKCLAAYSYSTEEVITALIENNLPPHLTQYLQSNGDDVPGPSTAPGSSTAPGPSNAPGPSSRENGVSRNPPDEPSKQKSSLIDSRQNVFDGDEFDVFGNPHDLNFERIHMGKKDKRFVGDNADPTKDFILKNQKFNFEYDEYDDEYDDTYDDLVATADDSLRDEPSQFVIKPLNVPLKDDGSDDEEQQDDNSDYRSTSARGRGRGRGRGGYNTQKQVVDKKGQKPDEKVLKQRARNERNKSSRANHNRRAGADKKRRGGMLHM